MQNAITEDSHNGIAAVLKTAGRKPVGVRIPRPPLLQFYFFLYMIKYIFILPFPLFLLSCSSSTEPQDESNAYCYYVIDGDSYRCIYENDSVEVRLLYVDCYETYYSERLTKQAERNNISLDSALKLGLEAKRFVKDLIEGKNIELIRIDDEPDKDVYGRLLRVVRYEGRRLDSILLKNGLAFEYEPF